MKIGSSTYTIRRIRLINWHNFLDETIDLAHGGHLFLLGDNGSGKTTVLDAVHYVLTAGENLEFNSAARVAGARGEGRRPQGVVMRYNVETGPLNESGGITYAALEIAGRHGVLSTYAVGLQVNAMDQQIRRWGLIRECTLEEIPLLLQRDGQMFPATRQEIRRHFESSTGYYANIESYKREVATRLFVSDTHFAEITRLLSMGKAYREIVAHSSDYHELFKRLLPEPQPDIFERIIATLNSLDQSAGDLERLEKQLQYLEGLASLVQRIEDSREQTLRLHWIKATLEFEQNSLAIKNSNEQIQVRAEQRQKLLQQLAQRQAEREAVERQIADLQAGDASGLVRQEKECARDVEKQMTANADAAENLKNAAKELAGKTRHTAGLRSGFTDTLRKLFADVNRRAPGLPVPLTDLASGIDAACRAEVPELHLDDIPFAGALGRLDAERGKMDTVAGQLEERREQAEVTLQTITARLDELRKQTEIAPDLPGYNDALKALQNTMLSVTPLYEGLEWQANVPAADKAAIEEAIGIDVLAIFVVEADDQEMQTAARTMYQAGPGLRIANSQDCPEVPLPSWIRNAFDPTRSDPAALRCLAEEMITRAGPEVIQATPCRVLRFRSHRRRLSTAPACLIGTQSRQDAYHKRLEQLTVEQRQAESELRRLENEQKKLRQTRQIVHQTIEAAANSERQLHRDAETIRSAAGEATHAGRRVSELRHNAEMATAELEAVQERLETIRQKISAEGLDKLEKRLGRMERKRKKLQEAEKDILLQQGSVDNQLKGLTATQQRLEEKAQVLRQQISAQSEHLRRQHPDIEDMAAYVLDVCGGNRFASLDAVEDALQNARDSETEAAAGIERDIRDEQFGATFAFAYDRSGNELLERGQRRIDELLLVRRREAEEQRELINERTRELFRKLVVGELLGHLREKIDILKKMVREINRLLDKRSFGANQYRFELHEVDRYRHLIKLVQHYNPWQTEDGHNELRQFFEDHKESITSTEVGSIPELLDYRNWYRYDMCLRTTNGEGVVIDRRTKSVGSGGEQAVPNYLLILTVAHFMFRGSGVPLHALLFDEAFYGIDTGRRDQILGFASDLDLQLFVASPDQDGVRREVPHSTTILVVKDSEHDVHLYPFEWENPNYHHGNLFAAADADSSAVKFGDEL